jgi:hypothetical protein
MINVTQAGVNGMEQGIWFANVLNYLMEHWYFTLPLGVVFLFVCCFIIMFWLPHGDGDL